MFVYMYVYDMYEFDMFVLVLLLGVNYMLHKFYYFVLILYCFVCSSLYLTTFAPRTIISTAS
jgi:hypothetical protein